MIVKIEVTNYPTEFLNSLNVPGTPSHNLQLKVETFITILRYLNHPKLFNGMRLSVKKLMNIAMIIKGKFKGYEVLIPLISIIPTDLPLQFKWIQFSVRQGACLDLFLGEGATQIVSFSNFW
ncbi:uncharacterized protein LOC112693701 [Sipha flava]|jgi:ATP-dependent DNA helicase PIF1|uniref:Uncharacterized protein LOC112693701 n=1 Tax=Sipha flava TaxID=143950 RepID=A0A8B8GQY4_9HEMI|nr:uncharacterized protein LOC112693701 [Sipha flava]